MEFLDEETKPVFFQIVDFAKHYLVECIFIFVAMVCTSAVVYLTFLPQKPMQEEIKENSFVEEEKENATLFVDVSGAVYNPGVYEVKNSSRIKDLLDLAGGATETADQGFIKRSINLARLVSDQEKIYIPFQNDITQGYIQEQTRILDYTSPLISHSQSALTKQAVTKISLQYATLDELDTLPGIGQVTAQKIMDNRPYATIDELVQKKIMSKTVFEKIKQLIEL